MTPGFGFYRSLRLRLTPDSYGYPFFKQNGLETGNRKSQTNKPDVCAKEPGRWLWFWLALNYKYTFLSNFVLWTPALPLQWSESKMSPPEAPLLLLKSENSRRLWLSEIPGWKLSCPLIGASFVSGLQKGPEKRCPARKLSKSVEKLFDTFWRFLTFFALRENCRKVSKNFLTIFDDFWRFLTWPLSAGPFCNPLSLLVRIGAEIGTCDRGGAIGPPDRSENDDRGGADLHRSASFRPPKPERANRDKFRKPSGMACSRFPNTIFSWDFPRFGHFNLVCYEKMFEGDGADRAGVIGLIRQGSQVWGWKQISLIVIGSVQIRGSWSANRGAIGQIRDN